MTRMVVLARSATRICPTIYSYALSILPVRACDPRSDRSLLSRLSLSLPDVQAQQSIEHKGFEPLYSRAGGMGVDSLRSQ